MITPEWLEEMVGQLIQPGVGAVGAKLSMPDGRLQHAGVVLGVGGVAAHASIARTAVYLGHFGHPALAPDSPSAVTAACMVVRREAWEQLAGLDEELADRRINDVDFCLRAAEPAGDRLDALGRADPSRVGDPRGGHPTRPTWSGLEVNTVDVDRWGPLLVTGPRLQPEPHARTARITRCRGRRGRTVLRSAVHRSRDRKRLIGRAARVDQIGAAVLEPCH